MTLELGDTVWIPCEVKHCVFPDERSVSIEVPEGRWAGFVNVKQLRDEILNGKTAIRATIVRTAPGSLCARLPGQTNRSQFLALPTI